MSEIDIDERTLKLIWRSIGVKPATQVAKETGLLPDQILRIRQRMREEIDVLTIEEKQFKILNELEDLKTDIRNKIEKVEDERNYAGIVNSFVSASKLLLAELKSMEKRNSSAVETLNAKRLQELLRLVQETVDITVPEIANECGIDEEALFQKFNANLVEAARTRGIE